MLFLTKHYFIINMLDQGVFQPFSVTTLQKLWATQKKQNNNSNDKRKTTQSATLKSSRKKRERERKEYIQTFPQGSIKE